MLEALPELFTRHRLAKPLAMASIAALGVGLLLVLVQIIWLVLGVRNDGVPSGAVAVTVVPIASAPAPSLARFHLFGNALPLTDTRALAQNAPDTSLQLTLHGLFATDDPKGGRVIIRDANGGEHAYSVGDDVGGATIDSIYADRVMLSRNGALEALRLPRADGATAVGPVPTMRIEQGPRSAVSMPLPGTQPAATPFVNPVMSMGGPALAQATQALIADPAKLAEQITALPVMENGKFVGVRIAPGRDATLFNRLGLQSDDVVTAVNGIALDSPARAQEIASSLSGATAATVTVRRNGKSQNLSVSLH